MSSTHQKLVEAARQAIQAVFGDTTVSQADTLASLEELETDIGAMICSLEIGPEEIPDDDDL